jgi:hypothetical protein
MRSAKHAAAFRTDGESDPYAAWRAVVRALRRVIPYIDVEEVNRFERLEDELDMPPSQFLALTAAITEETGIELPQDTLTPASTLDELAQYVAVRLEGVDDGVPRRTSPPATE